MRIKLSPSWISALVGLGLTLLIVFLIVQPYAGIGLILLLGFGTLVVLLGVALGFRSREVDPRTKTNNRDAV